MESTLICNSPAQVEERGRDLVALLRNLSFENAAGERMGYEIVIQPHTGKKRTSAQNNALHLWLEQTAKVYRDAGIDAKLFFMQLKGAGIPVSADMLKELWRITQQTYTGERSTAMAKTKDYHEVYAILSKALAERHGIEPPPWPDRFGVIGE